YNNTLSPNLIMTAGFGWIGEINNQFNQTKFNPTQIVDGIIPPYITWDGQHTLTKWGTQGSWLQSINRKLGIAIENNYLYTKGRNTYNFGIDIRRSYQDDNEDQTQGGEFDFSQRTTADPNNLNTTGSSFASFLLGQVDAANRSNSQELRLRNLAISPYVQDDIKLTPKLTLNLGLRWDIQVPFTENNNLIVFFNPDTPNPAAGGRLGAATKFGYGPGLTNYNRAGTHFGHFGPRLGFAYQVSNKMVVQGGFSVAFLNGGAYEYGTSKTAVNYGNLLVGSFTRLKSGTNVPTYGSWDVTQLPNPTPKPFSSSLGVGTQINDFSHDDGFAPYSQQWNLNVQRELGWNTFMQAAWVGNRVIHLPSQLNAPNQLNPAFLSLTNDLALTFSDGSAQAKGYALPYPNFVADFGKSATVAQSLTPYPQYTKIFNNFEGSGTTYYQALQVQVEKRWTNGLSFLAGYTLSRQYDNTSSGFSSFANGGLNKYNQSVEWAVSSNSPPSFFKASGTYELPIGPGKTYLNNRGVTGQIVGGWQVGFIVDEEAGTPTGVSENGVPFPNGFNRPNRVSTVGLKTGSYSKVADQFSGKIAAAQIFNPAGFAATPSQYVLGNSIRNYNELRNPANYNEDVNVRKHFFFGERFQGILQVDYFNVFNRTIFQNPDNNVSDGTFGQVTGQGGNNQIGPNNRQGQVSFRLEF
ncbi:MAG TPA: TonB-dependent receptor, partial [Acidobacteriaceae bacterium]|nr:TonB-dependent receptor [Acidobacteriaceae bacterium]